jgi:hypothetical protein
LISLTSKIKNVIPRWKQLIRRREFQLFKDRPLMRCDGAQARVSHGTDLDRVALPRIAPLKLTLERNSGVQMHSWFAL